jgi:SNF2 family DNA or RNA helicase
MEPGTGKTLTAITAANEIDAERILVVCPVSAIGVWEHELFEERQFAFIPEGTRTEKSWVIENAGRWLILNYEALLSPAVEKAVQKWGPSLVIIDESHKIKTATARRSRVLHRLTKGRRTFLLSGTPITRNLLDLYSQYKAIDPGIWDNKPWTKFRYRYARYGGYMNKEIIGYQNVAELKRRIRTYSFILRKEDALELPPWIDQIVPVRLSPVEWKRYTDLVDGGLWGDKPVKNPLERALRLQQLVGRFKHEATVDTVRELLEADQKVLVFYRFRDEGKALARALFPTIGYELHGDVPAKARTERVAAFQAHDGPAVFLAQISAGSVAISLTAASEVVYHSLSWAYEDYVQSRDRVHRIGQDRPVTYRHMVAVGHEHQRTIDSLVLRALQTKKDVAAMIVADPSLLDYTERN